MANFFYWIYKFTSTHRLLGALLLLIVLGLSGWSILQLRFEENITEIMPKDKAVAQLGDVLEGFSMNKRIVVHVYSKVEAQPDSLIKRSHQLVDSLQNADAEYIANFKLEIPDSQIQTLYDYYYKNLPFYLQPSDYDSIAEQVSKEGVAQTVKQIYKSLMSPMGVVTQQMLIKDPFGMTRFPLERTSQLQLDDNFSLYKNHILTKDRRHLIFFIALANSPNETDENSQLMADLDRFAHQISSRSTVKIEYFGAGAMAVANANQIKEDIYLTVSIALVGLLLFISFFYRKVSVFFIAVTPGLFGGVVAVAVLSLLKDQVSVISLAVGSVLLGITIDYALHLFTHAKQEHVKAKLFDDLTVPMLMSSITTACAFFSLLFLRSTALQDLGVFAGVSVLMASLYTLIVLPHMVSEKQQEKSSKPNVVEKWVAGIANYPLYKKKWALLAVLVLSILSFFTWNKVTFESDMLGLSYKPEKLANYEAHINEISNYSANNIYVATTGSDIWEALQANQPLQKVLHGLRNDSAIYEYTTLNAVVPTLEEQQKRLQQWDSFWSKHESAIQMLNAKAEARGFNAGTFSEFDSLVEDSYDHIAEESLAQLMQVIGEDLVIKNKDHTVSVLSTVKLPAQNKSMVLERLENIGGLLILDRGYLTSKLVTLLKEDFNKLVNISLLVVFVIILLSYGRIELALITYLPILISWLWVLGLMGFFGLKFNIVNIIICTFIFGLGVDYSIFVMRGLLQSYKYGKANLSSYKKSIILSVVTTLLGIGVLAFAKHPALQSIALLAIIGIVSVIIITFTIEHLLFNLLIGKRKKKGVVPFTLFSLLMTITAFSYFLLGCLILQVFRLLLLIPVGPIKPKKKFMHRLMMFFTHTLVYLMANFPKKVIDKQYANYDKPSVIIANHHSFIDILIMLMFSPKVVMVTNDWVYFSPFFGKPVQYADFIHAGAGMEGQMPKIRKLVEEGYSIIVFPEGTRTGSFKLRRFHKGAFFLAEQLKLDIQPVILHGTSLVMPKGDDFYLKNNRVTIKFLPRIKHDDISFGTGYSERTKKISKYFKGEYKKLRIETETPKFFSEILIKNYLYKGPILEWYVKVKYAMEKQYQLFHELIPLKAKITDLGCGYGIMDYALCFASEGREIKGYDYDQKKIEVAKNCPVQPEKLQFAQGDVMQIDFEPSDVFLLSDVLHYLIDEEQLNLLEKMASHLNEGGMLIIRDGDSEKESRHKGTKLTEFFSTNIGFNKTRNKMNYISGKFVKDFADANNLSLEIIDNTKRTSNTVFVLKKN